jgi:hypothetical protein
MLPRTISIWQRDSQPNASGRPGAVHVAPGRESRTLPINLHVVLLDAIGARHADLAERQVRNMISLNGVVFDMVEDA